MKSQLVLQLIKNFREKKMKKLALVTGFLSLVTIFAASSIYGVTCGNGITYTSIGNPRLTSGGPTISTTSHGLQYNDTSRLQALLTTCTGKIIFDEAAYFIDGTLPVFGARILEGSGSNTVVSFPSSKIVQEANLPIFKIGTNVYDVAIRDLGLVGGLPTRNGEGTDINTGMYGILAEGGTTNNCTPNSSPPDTGNCTSLGVQISNLSFTNLNKGIYVNALNNGEWQFDNVRLDHSRFYNCIIGVHINSFNSGWNISSLDFLVPNGVQQGTDETISGKTYGIYLQRSTYTSMDLLIGNGPSSTGPSLATALIYVKEHGNLSIQSTVAEGFREDLVIDGNTRNSPINLMNNTFMNGVRVKNATIYSSSNQYSAFNNHGAPTTASGTAQIYSLGDKYCAEGDYLNCDEGRGFVLSGEARNIFVSTQNGSRTQVPFFISKDIFTSSDPIINQFTSAPALSLIAPNQSSGPLLRIGRGIYVYDITRNEGGGSDAGYLEFQGTQSGYGGYSFKTTGGTVTVNYNGSVTYGSAGYSSLGSPANGTVIYCSDCQKATPCSGSGNGALAKRVNGSWDCD